MTNSNEESLSSLVDGELSAQESHNTINQLLNSSSTRDCWERYHLISDALKRNLPAAINRDFCTNVMAALKDEPTVLAPRRRSPGTLTKRLAGVAVAASVAAIGVLGVQNLYQEDGLVTPPAQIAQSPLPSAQTAMQSPIVGSGVRPGIQLVQQGALVQGFPSPQLQSLPPNLNRYLIDHNQQTARGVQGIIPYARIVTYPTLGSDSSRAQK